MRHRKEETKTGAPAASKAPKKKPRIDETEIKPETAAAPISKAAEPEAEAEQPTVAFLYRPVKAADLREWQMEAAYEEKCPEHEHRIIHRLLFTMMQTDPPRVRLHNMH